MPSVHIDPQPINQESRSALYSGDIIILSPTPATEALVALAKKMLEGAFAPHDPRCIHKRRSADQVAAVLADVKPRFIHHQECKRLIPMIMREHGVDLDKVYFDVPRLRSAYPTHFLASGIAYAFHPHRDTWYSAPMCQLNWWMPVYPLDPDNAMAFYHRYFDEPVKNNSEIYNYYEWNTKNRATAALHVKTDNRAQPKALQNLVSVTSRYLPPPCGMIVFSGAQLHETVPNATDVARYSIDFRTVDFDDVVARRGARNVDSRSTGTTMRDYLRASDLGSLPQEIIRMYDDDSASMNKVLVFGDRLTKRAAASEIASSLGSSPAGPGIQD